MGVVIKSISLENWFNYHGEFKENTIKFKKGCNLYNGDNNSGKSKLHNAIRWIINNDVIYEKDCVEINKNNFDGIINKDYYSSLNVNDPYKFGVEIEFEKTYERRDNIEKVKLRKLIKGTKGGGFKIIKEVHLPGRNGNFLIRRDERFEDKKIINKALFEFLFLEGEQIKNKIPFSGRNLETAINSITNINSIEKYIKQGDKITNQIIKIENHILDNEKNQDLKRQEDVEEKKNCEEIIKEKTNLFKDRKEELKDLHEEIKALESIANEAKQQKEILDKHKELSSKITRVEEKIDECRQDFFLLISKRFEIRKYLTNNQENDDINGELKKLRTLCTTFIQERKNELDSNATPEELEMLEHLINNQPGIDVLKKIAENKCCYICGTTDLLDHNIKYITKRVIPKFENIDYDDDELKLYDSINQLINQSENIISTTFNSTSDDACPFEEKLSKISELLDRKNNLEEELTRFEEEHGKGEEDHAYDLSKYGELCQKEGLLEKEKNDYKEEINEQKTKLDAIEIRLKNQKNKTINKELQTVETLKSFQLNVNSILEEIKTKIYQDFCKELEEKASNRLDKYFGRNPSINGKKFKVSHNLNKDEEHEFSIKVLDKNDLEDSDPGGAETSIRQYCIILSMLELAKANNTYNNIGNQPLIIDAPVSNLNQEYILDFYKHLIEEDVTEQIIIMSYDLVGISEINEDGKQIIEIMKKAPDKYGTFNYKKDKTSKLEEIEL